VDLLIQWVFANFLVQIQDPKTLWLVQLNLSFIESLLIPASILLKEEQEKSTKSMILYNIDSQHYVTMNILAFITSIGAFIKLSGNIG
jgi:hypothetical protein